MCAHRGEPSSSLGFRRDKWEFYFSRLSNRWHHCFDFLVVCSTKTKKNTQALKQAKSLKKKKVECMSMFPGFYENLPPHQTFIILTLRLTLSRSDRVAYSALLAVCDTDSHGFEPPTSTNACRHICRYVDQKGSAAMLTSIQSAGVTPEVNLEESHTGKKVCKWEITRSPKMGISGPTKRTYVLQRIDFKKKTNKTLR